MSFAKSEISRIFLRAVSLGAGAVLAGASLQFMMFNTAPILSAPEFSIALVGALAGLSMVGGSLYALRKSGQARYSPRM